MDGHPYPSNGINTTSAQTYPSPTAVSPHQLQSGSPLPQTLPPLQPPASAMQPLYGSHPHTPRTPGTPNTPNSAHNLPAYQQTSQPGSRPGMYSMPQNPYPPHPGYGTSAAMMPQATTAASHPQPIAPAPAGTRGPPVLRPMPPGGIMSQPGVPSPYMNFPNDDVPTHVVGSQGRRGILPSAPGRPAAPAAGTGSAKSTVIPVKDADGKFPCPHCTKTYLHAKHLKRHLLRHTGDRPYMCVLCRDTFSRSDILKRHFQKCSIRRGNPTGASHLSHPQAHVKKNAQAQKAAAMGNEGDMNHLNGLNNMPGDGMVHPFGMVPVPEGLNNMGNNQDQLSRSGSMNRLDNGNNGDRRGMPGPVMGGSQPYGSDPGSMNNQQMPNYNMPPGQNGMPMYGGSNANQQSGLDWSQMFQAGAHQTYANNSFPPNLGQTQIGTKTEPNTESGATAGGSNDTLLYSNWGMPSNSQQQVYNQLSNQILNFFYPPHQAIDPHMAGMNLYFSPENIKDFLDKYTHFHVHLPLLHTPTFRITEAYTGLLACMCCIGACYSDKVDSGNVREMMDFLWVALERDCKMLSSTASHNHGMPLTPKTDLEELQAVLLATVLHMWNGTPQQRDRSRRTFSLLASQSRKLGLLHLSQGPSFSPLHQSDAKRPEIKPEQFSWEVWVDQERRFRAMYGIFLCDTALGLYFNTSPHFDPFEMRIPLPCDDAAWDAYSAKDCSAALGFEGPDALREKNPFGTQRSSQPEMDRVLKALLHPSYQIQPGGTNLYGKFIIIHAVLYLIRRALVEGSTAQLYNYGTPPPSDWMSSAGVNSGAATPIDGVAQNMDPKNLKALNIALDKFKSNWDVDMGTQFPMGGNNPRRHGFSRDGIHFFWLAKYVLKHTRPSDLQLPPDARFMQVMQLLKSVKAWVMSDGAARGEEMGSVGEIDDHYGATNLTLEMSQLFKPLPQVVEDAGTASVKTEIGTD